MVWERDYRGITTSGELLNFLVSMAMRAHILYFLCAKYARDIIAATLNVFISIACTMPLCKIMRFDHQVSRVRAGTHNLFNYLYFNL